MYCNFFHCLQWITYYIFAPKGSLSSSWASFTFHCSSGELFRSETYLKQSLKCPQRMLVNAGLRVTWQLQFRLSEEEMPCFVYSHRSRMSQDRLRNNVVSDLLSCWWDHLKDKERPTWFVWFWNSSVIFYSTSQRFLRRQTSHVRVAPPTSRSTTAPTLITSTRNWQSASISQHRMTKIADYNFPHSCFSLTVKHNSLENTGTSIKTKGNGTHNPVSSNLILKLKGKIIHA